GTVKALLSQTCLLLGKHDEALQYVEELRAYAQQRNYSMYLLMALMNEAHFVFAQGDDTKGDLLLRKSFGLARECGHLFAPFDNPAVTIDLCEKALEAGIEAEY